MGSARWRKPSKKHIWKARFSSEKLIPLYRVAELLCFYNIGKGAQTEEGIAVDTRDDGARFNDSLKAAMAAAANLFFLVAVTTIQAVQSLVFKGHQLSGVSLVVFIIGELVIIVYFTLLAASDRLGVLVEMLVRAARSGIAEEGDRCEEKDLAGGGVRRVLTNLWTPVTLNFMLAGGLVYASGGIVNSPYSQIPIAMMLIGQSVYGVPPIELRHHSGIPRIVVFAASVARLYIYPLFLMVALELSLVVLQATHPLVRTPAPTAELLVTTLITLFAGMCVTFVTRRADQASAVVPLLPRDPIDPDGGTEPVDPDEDRSDDMTPVG